MLDLYVDSGGKKLRCGYTTGSCATAAAKAATLMLFNDKVLEYVTIETPKGIEICIKLNNVEIGQDYVKVSVLKDAGDDADITDGIEIWAKVEKISEGIIITGGEGVGIVTKDGLFVPKGEYAINPTPRKTIEEAVGKNLPKGQGVKVTISVSEGIEIAKKTFNPRLGIEGGISIIGTTGIVYPMSEEALKESIKLEIKQKAMNNDTLVLTFGNIGERCSKEQDFHEDKIVIISNFVGFALECCISEKVKKVILVGHIGKISKIAFGCFNTHSRVSDVRLEVIALELALLGYDSELIKEVLKEKTSEGAVKFLGNGYENLYSNIGRKVIERMKTYTYGELECEAIMYYGFSDYNILFNSLIKE